MINRTLEILMKRRSIRAYTDKPIHESDKQRLFNCAMRAATAGNMMLHSMIEVVDQALKDKLAATCGNQLFIAKAPLVVLFVADCRRIVDYFLAFGADSWAKQHGQELRQLQEGDLLLAVSDALIAAQSMVTAAESLGIGSCYVGNVMGNYETHREMLKLPDYTFPVTLLCFGYPHNPDLLKRQIPRLEEKFVRFKNEYKRFDDADLVHLMDHIEDWEYQGKAHDYEEGNIGAHLYKTWFAADFSREINRSVRAALETWRKDKQ